MSVSRTETLPEHTPEGLRIIAPGKKSGTRPLFLPGVNETAQEDVLRESATDGGFPQNAKSSGRMPAGEHCEWCQKIVGKTQFVGGGEF